MKIFHITFFLIFGLVFSSSSFAIINIPAEAHKRGSSNLILALNIADNIASREASMNNVLGSITRDHTEERHAHGASYFRTESRSALRKILHYAIGHAHNYDVTTRHTPHGTRYRLVIHAEIPAEKSLEFIGKRNIGVFGRTNNFTKKVQLCFGINGIETLSDSLETGAFLTAYPSEVMTGCD